MAKRDYSAITPEILKLSELCAQNSVINSELYVEHKVYRGLRDLNGNGVLTGLTEVSEIQSSRIDENGNNLAGAVLQKKDSNGKVVAFMKRNAVYLVLAFCILAVSLSITFISSLFSVPVYATSIV